MVTLLNTTRLLGCPVVGILMAVAELAGADRPFVPGQKIKLVIAACLWNNPQVRRGCIEIVDYGPSILNAL